MFFIPLEVQLPEEKVEADYCSKLDKQDIEDFKILATKSGFIIMKEWKKKDIFFLELMKH